MKALGRTCVTKAPLPVPKGEEPVLCDQKLYLYADGTTGHPPRHKNDAEGVEWWGPEYPLRWVEEED